MNEVSRGPFHRSAYVWAFTTYFAEGFPFTVIRSISAVFMRSVGVSLESVGLTSLFGIPWIIKFLWAPHVDKFGTKRQWMLICQCLITIMIILAGIFAPLSWGVQAIAILFFIGAFISATNDIAIDGYYLDALDSAGQAKFVGYRVMAYRIAMMSGGVVPTLAAKFNWTVAFMACAVWFGLVSLYHLFFLPEVEKQKPLIRALVRELLTLRLVIVGGVLALVILGWRWFIHTEAVDYLYATLPFLKKISFSQWMGILLLAGLVGVLLMRGVIERAIVNNPESFYSKAFLTFISRERIAAILLFVIFFRTGEFMVSSMLGPFFVDLGIMAHYVWLSSGVGLPCSIIGAMLGGWLISRKGLKRIIWPLVLAQNFSLLLYMMLALILQPWVVMNTGSKDPASIGLLNLVFVGVIHGFDQLASGLGTAVLMTCLMRICQKEFKASHFAIGTGLMSVSSLFSGVLSGFLAAWLGYGLFFGISFLFALPGMIAVAFLPAFMFEERPKVVPV